MNFDKEELKALWSLVVHQVGVILGYYSFAFWSFIFLAFKGKS